jgi:subtilisin family serine protease
MGVRMARDDGILIYDNEGVQWAADNGAKVISMSYCSPVPEQTGRQVLQTAYEHGIILVAAAGNGAKESQHEGFEPNQIIYPAGYPFVIGVASVNNNRKLSSFSQYGADRADIAAPGGFTVINNREWLPTILSTTYCKTQLLRLIGFNFSDVYYDAMHGTSMACPIVAGLCGLLASAYPDITPAQAKECLQSTAQPLAPGSNQIGGNGIINAYSAVLCAQELAGNVGICDKLTLTNQISVYPNPAQDILYVVSEEGEVKKIEILDVAGRCVVTEQMPKSETILSISNLTSGLYLLKFTCSNNEIIIKKFIKQ